MWRWYDPAKYPGDESAVSALHRAMEKRLGRSIDLPDLSDAPVFAAVVREVEGEVTHCLFLEALCEAQAIGEKPLTARAAQSAIDEFLLPAARLYRLRMVRAVVPAQLLPGKRKRKGAIVRLLEGVGFTRENESVAQFYRWLAPPQQGERNSSHG